MWNYDKRIKMQWHFFFISFYFIFSFIVHWKSTFHSLPKTKQVFIPWVLYFIAMWILWPVYSIAQVHKTLFIIYLFIFCRDLHKHVARIQNDNVLMAQFFQILKVLQCFISRLNLTYFGINTPFLDTMDAHKYVENKA